MSHRNLLQQVIGATLVVVFLVGCGAPAATPLSEAPAATSMPAPSKTTPTPESPTATPTQIPPTPTPTPIPPTPTSTQIPPTPQATGRGGCSPLGPTYVLDRLSLDPSKMSIIAELPCDEEVTLKARSKTGLWFLIDVPGQPGQEGWVYFFESIDVIAGRWPMVKGLPPSFNTDYGYLASYLYDKTGILLDGVTQTIMIDCPECAADLPIVAPEPQDKDGLPDLVLGDLFVSRSCSIRTSITNVGDAAAPPNFSIRIGEKIRREELDVWIEPGESYRIGVGAIGLSEQEYHYTITVDPNNEIKESSEENNTLESSIGTGLTCTGG